MAGRFISLEGGEGTGKSTQAKALAKAIESKGITVHLTREPGGTPGAEIIRNLLLTGQEDKWNMRTEALLFAAARAEHCQSLIEPALEKDEWIISDRFIDSSRAYQSVSGQLNDEDIMALHRVGSCGLMPHRTFILDLPEEVAARRADARDRGDSDRIGGRDSDYHHSVMSKFREYAKDEPGRIKLIDAAESQEDITANLLHDLSDLLD
ncbi:dTMP kinase [Parasphingorhabdus cellanae]|uniref:Thymidylate kinase n=1 Tax=Parasphingorhabdus cellanae TaxID=2806553 RepID=A0ABX7T3S7_9SPHN|nr:dTMP kinase [Parasphingorhabdus cellanae]QTD56229.1 dTMP kinase [Parasphingorhabdus cellanae]